MAMDICRIVEPVAGRRKRLEAFSVLFAKSVVKSGVMRTAFSLL